MVILVYSKFKKHIPRDEVSLALPAEQSIPECFTPVHLVVDKFQYVYDGKLDAGLSNMYYESLGAAIRISVSFFCNDRSPFELKNVKQLTRDATPIVRRRLSACTNWYTDTSGRSMDIYTTTKLARVRRRVPIEWPDFDRVRSGDEYHVRDRRSWRQRIERRPHTRVALRTQVDGYVEASWPAEIAACSSS
jgi:hypothetical protein